MFDAWAVGAIQKTTRHWQRIRWVMYRRSPSGTVGGRCQNRETLSLTTNCGQRFSAITCCCARCVCNIFQMFIKTVLIFAGKTLLNCIPKPVRFHNMWNRQFWISLGLAVIRERWRRFCWLRLLGIINTNCHFFTDILVIVLLLFRWTTVNRRFFRSFSYGFVQFTTR